MDLVIPYRSLGDDGQSLKYALRSAVVFLAPIDRLVIIGDRPKGLNGYDYIEMQDLPLGRNRERSIFNKIATACMDDSISEDFIYFHDDHFLLSGYQDGNIPNYYMDDFEGNELYKNTVRNTLRLFPGAKNFDVHFPMIINKDKFLKTVATLDWKIPYGYCIKTCYAIMNNLKGTFKIDSKIRQPYMNPGNLYSYLNYLDWFSIDDAAMNSTMIVVLNSIYNFKTIFEDDAKPIDTDDYDIDQEY